MGTKIVGDQKKAHRRLGLQGAGDHKVTQRWTGTGSVGGRMHGAGSAGDGEAAGQLPEAVSGS
jgi:hypothetical protein